MLVGRDEQLAAVSAALAADTPVVVEGEGGIGKTALLRAVAEASARPTFEGGALATLAWLPYLPFERALHRRVTETDPTLVAGAVESVVNEGVLIVDDLHWAAPATLECVSLLAGRIGLLAAVRRGDPGSENALATLRENGFAVVHLPALPERSARRLLGQLRPGLGAAAAGRLIARAGGNPLLIRELSSTGMPSESLRLALAARLRRLDDAGRDAFRVLAVIGHPLPRDVLGAAGVASLLAAELAVHTADGEIEARHALLAEVAVAQMDAEELRRTHAAAARIVVDDGEAARHHAAAGERARAYQSARRAADAAATPGERATHLAVAASCADGPAADELRLRAAWALADAQDWPALSALLSEFDTDEPTIRATAALIRARGAWHAGEPDELRAALDEGSALVGDRGSDIAVRLRIERSRIPIFIDSNPAAAVASTTDALELAIAAGVDVARAQYLHGTALYLAQRPDAAHALENAVHAARADSDLGTEMLAANNLIAFHESMGDQSAARRIAAEFSARARAMGLGVWERSFRIASSNLDFHAGRYPAVLDTADELLELPLDRRTRESLLEQMCLALVDLGRIDEAQRRIGQEPQRPGDWTWERQVLWVRAEAALWGGQPQEALDLAESLLLGPAGDLNIAFAHCTRAWATYELGRAPHSSPVLELPAMLAAVPSEVAGVIELGRGDPTAAVAEFDHAATGWRNYHRRGELRCTWAAGEAARQAGASDAVDRLLLSEQDALRHGMLPLLGRIHRSLRAAGIRRAAPRQRRRDAVLSARERQVLELVASGLNNNEIAARLGVSRHTVVSQITSASAKLGASGRNHAATLASLLDHAS